MKIFTIRAGDYERIINYDWSYNKRNSVSEDFDNKFKTIKNSNIFTKSSASGVPLIFCLHSNRGLFLYMLVYTLSVNLSLIVRKL